MAEVAWAPQALKHVEKIVDYVAKDVPTRALALSERLMAEPDRLESLPRMGRVVPEFRLEHVRELVTVRPYRISYTIDGDTCTVVAVSNRDLKRALKRRDLEKP